MDKRVWDTFGVIVEERICPVVLRVLRGRCDFSLMVRTMRTILVLVSDLRSSISNSKCNAIMSALLDMIDDPVLGKQRTVVVTPLWHHALVLETLHGLCAIPDVMLDIYCRFDVLEGEEDVFGGQ